MQKIAAYCIAASALLAACSNDFDLTTDWQDIPIVYGILSPKDTAHYFRIEKAFVDPEKSALEIAQIPDSLYYDNVLVTLTHINDGEDYNLMEVIGADEGYPREDGIFANVPNILFKMPSGALQINGGDRYRLTVNRGESLPEVSAEIEMVRSPSIRRSTLPQNLRFDYTNNFRVGWSDIEAGFFDIKLLFHYRQWHASTPQNKIDTMVVWKFGSRIKNDEYSVLGKEFYDHLASQLEEDPQILRAFLSIDIIVQAAGQELEDLIEISLANTGITSVGDFPQYSNIEGGRGLFSSVNEDRVNDLSLHPISLDSLRNGSITGDLNFQ